jgi:hypothetical protein
MSPALIAVLNPTPAHEQLLTGTPNAFSGIYGPEGRLVSEPIVDQEGIVYADIDLSRCIEPKQYQDILGHYNRFDIFTLEVNRTPLEPIRFRGAKAPAESSQVANESDAEPVEDRAASIVRLRASSDQ